MQEPQSLKNDQVSQFPQGKYDSLRYGFCYNNPFTTNLTFTQKTYKVSLQGKILNQNSPYKITDDIKVLLDLKNNTSVYCNLNSNNQFKIHYDNGINSWKNMKWNFYGSFTSNRSIKNTSLKGGATYISDNINISNTLKVYLRELGNTYNFNHRTIFNKNNFTFSYIGAYDFTSKLVLNNSFLISYKWNQYRNISLRSEFKQISDSNFIYRNWRQYFDTLKVNYVSSVNNTTNIGIQAWFSLRQFKLKRVEWVGQKKFMQQKGLMKILLTNNFDIAFSIKKPIMGWEDFTLTTSGCFSQIHKNTRNCSYGIQLDLNQ